MKFESIDLQYTLVSLCVYLEVACNLTIHTLNKT